MKPIEQDKALLPNATCKIEAHHLGHAVNLYAELNGGASYMRQLYYVADMYAKPKGNSHLDCLRWAHRNDVEITA